MTKRIISVFLVLVLCVALAVPAFAANFNTLIKLEDTSASNSSYSSYSTVYDASTGKSSSFGYTVPTDGATVLVFYIAGGDNDSSSALVSSLSSALWAKSDKLNFIAIEWQKANQTTVKNYMSTYDTNGVFDKSYYNASANYITTWYYNFVKNGGNMSSITAESISSCFVIYISSQNSKKYIRYAETGVNSASQISDALSKFMDTSSLVSDGYSGYLNSGSTALEKPTKSEIAKLLAANPQSKPSADADYFDVQPVTSGSYATGTVKNEYLQAATDRLSALRKIAGLPAVTMDTSMNSDAQYGAVLLANAEFAHKPEKPTDMDDSFFTKGRAATESSNLAAGRQLTETPDGFMRDEGTHNLPTMGHRRWQLNPRMAKVGFGFAVNPNNAYSLSHGVGQYKYYTDEKCMDSSGESIDYRFISWPASGNFPNQLFAYDTAWSVTLNPAYYQTPDISKVNVTVKRASDSKKWTFSDDETYELSDDGKYFTVNNDGYGVSNCIIFRPEGISTYEGVYTVVISGLYDSFGNSVTLSYKVDFFNADDYKDVKSGLIKENGNYYYYKDGVMQTGWQKIKRGDGKTYYHYFGTDGIMRKGWQKITNSKGKTYTYYFGTNGCMVTGWQSIKNSKGVAYKYYFHTNGVMLTGWQNIKASNGKTYRYYFYPKNGVMLTGWQDIKASNGKTYRYYFYPKNGVMLTGWQNIKASNGKTYKYYFYPKNGVMLTGWQKIKASNGKTYMYYFNTKNGVMLTNWQWIKNSKGVKYRYYFGANGVMRTGWQKIKASNGKTYKYYFYSNGVNVINKSVKIGSKTYKFNKYGICTNA